MLTACHLWRLSSHKWLPKPARFSTWLVLQIRVPFRVLFLGVPYYCGDLHRDPNSRSGDRGFNKYKFGLIMGGMNGASW